MSRRPHRNHTAAFKAKVSLAALQGDKILAQLSEQFELHPNQIVQWKKQLEQQASEVFGKPVQADQVIDIKPLHAKIGQLTLESDFLETALIKAGFLSSKR